MLNYKMLAAKKGAFKSMTGVSVEEFETLLSLVRPRYEAIVKAQVERPDRKRAPGAGEKSRYDVTERLLMTLVWLRLYVTFDAIGVLFGMDKGTVSRFTRLILLILRDLGHDTLGWPKEARELVGSADSETGPADQDSDVQTDPDEAGQGRPDDEPDDDPWAEANEWPEGVDRQIVLTPDQSGCPDYLAFVDATEQPVERSSDYETQKKFYSGKRKSHTIKTEIVVNERGRIRHVSESVPGSTHDLTLLRQSGVPALVPPGVTVGGDCGYRGMHNDFPNHSVILPYRPDAGTVLTPEQKLHNHFLASIRVVVENTLAELKHFQALVVKFRHSLERYGQVFRSVVGIINRRIDCRLAQLAIQGSTHA